MSDMKRLSVFLSLLATAILLAAQVKDDRDSLALLENKVWKARLPENTQTAYETEFRDGQWISALLYQGERHEMIRSYVLLRDTLEETDSGKKFKILGLTDSTLVFRYLPTSLTIGVGPVEFTTDNSAAGQRANEHRLDSIWRRELIWNLGVLDKSGKPMRDTSAIERPRWVNWGEDLERYFVSQMRYPEALLKQNRAGYSVVMFTVDTLGLPRGINCLTSTREEFGREVVRLLKELPHGQPCWDATGRRMECLYAVYVPFLPQHYRHRLKADSIREEEHKQMFITWDAPARFPDKNPLAIRNYIARRLKYDPSLLGEKTQTRGVYSISIDSYGEVKETKVIRSCGIEAWDKQVIDIIRSMPRWIPATNSRGKGEYRDEYYALPFIFRNDKRLIAHTAEKHLEAGVPVCYLNERGDTIVPYGKYRFCQTDTIRRIGFVYENKAHQPRIICLDTEGKKLFYVFPYDNGPDYAQEGVFRITDEEGRIGFADTLGTVLIRPQYKFATPFRNGKAKATFSGSWKQEGEHRYWDSSEWFYIDKAGIAQ